MVAADSRRPLVATSPARPAIVGVAKNSRSPGRTPNACCTRVTTCIAFRLCPPSSKKLSSIPIRATCSTSRQIAASFSSHASRGAWKALLRSLPGTPDLVIYDSDKAVAEAAPEVWPTVPVHLCEHHLYVNGRGHLREDGQHGLGNVYRALLSEAAKSHTGWSVFRNAVLADASLIKTGKWVRHWDEPMTAQTARRPGLPAHHSTGALDPHLAKVRQVLKPRAWTYRNLDRMDALLGLVRLSINLCDRPGDWAKLITARAASRPAPTTFDEPPTYLPNDYRVYSVRLHPVPPSG